MSRPGRGQNQAGRSGGRAGRQGGRGNRNQTSQAGKQNGKQKKGMFRPRFTGAEPELQGFIFDCESTNKSDLYNKTKLAIEDYVGRKYDNEGDMHLALQNLKDPQMEMPERIEEEGLSQQQKRDLEVCYTEELKNFVKRKNQLKANKKKCFSLILGQCTPAMRGKIESHDNYEEASTELDPINLLKIIKSVVFEFQAKKYIMHSVVMLQE